MEYFKSSLKSVLGSQNAESQLSGAEIVEKLVDRIQSSTLLNDRRDACRALKALSRTYRIEVGTLGMDALKQILDMDRTDCEIIGLVLDTLCNITSSETFNEEIQRHETKHNIGAQFTEIIIKNPDNVTKILRFLEEFDFRVRWPALKLLSNLLLNKPKDIQEIILVSPMGVSKLMDILGDSREVIRNDALLLLIQLTKSNTNIQKIVAFENAFDRIYDVIIQEGGIEGGIVVEDSLLLLINLLRGNFSNQNFFKEGCYIQKLTPIFQATIDSNDGSSLGWNPQKISNIHCVIQVIRALVAPSGPAQSVSSCQEIMRTCGLLQIFCNLLMISGVPADILTETINTVAEIIRGNKQNQHFFSSIMAPSSPPRPIIVVLLMSMVNEKQSFFLRCAVLYCFQCFLYKNDTLQMQFVQTLLPQGNDNTSVTTGQLLCGGLFSSEPLSNWFSAVAISYSLIDGSNQKEQLLRVLLATNIGTPPVTLLQQCVVLLQQSNNTQSKLGLLMLLCTWTSHCTAAVKNFLTIDSSVPYLIALLSSQESNDNLGEILLQSMCAFLIGICVHFNDDSVPNYTKKSLCNLIENRITLEKFQDTIGEITRHEIYSRSLKHPQPCAKDSSEVLLDHEFCRLLKHLEGTVLKSVLDYNEVENGAKEMFSSNSAESSLIVQYKKVIREQDEEIQKLNTLVDELKKEKQQLKDEVTRLEHEVESLSDQTKILRAAQTNYSGEKSLDFVHDGSSDEKFEQYKKHIKDLEMQLSQSALVIQELENKSSEHKKYENLEQMLQIKNEEYDKLKKDQEDLLELLMEQDNKLMEYKKKFIALNAQVDSDDSSNEQNVDQFQSNDKTNVENKL